MNKCPNCGKEFEGKFCPDCGAEWQEEKTCPKCGAKLNGSAKFCNECGYSFENTTKKPNKKISVLDWIKSHLKIVIPVALAAVLIIVLACSIPACIAAQTNGTYYKLNPDGELDKKTYFILSSGKWEDEDGESGTYKKDGDKIIFSVKFFGKTEEFCDGTVKDGVLKIKDPLGMGTEDTYISEKHEHKFGEWEVITEPNCTNKGLQTRICNCGVKENSEIPVDLNAHSIISYEANEVNHTGTCTICGKEIREVHSKENCICGYPYIFTLNSDGNGYEFSHFYSSEAQYKIPSTYKDLPVTSIGDSAFEGCSGLTSVTIPDGITEIGDSAFEWCSGLTSVVIPDSVTSIGKSVFYGCSGLTSITIPDGVTKIEYRAFYDCDGLTSITIPDSVTSIGEAAFKGCSGLTSVSIPDGVTEIGGYAFKGCSKLTSITIPDGVTEIGEYTFYGCSVLTSIAIPDSVTSFGNYTFADCSGLTDINFNGTKEQWNAIEKGNSWASYAGDYTVHCIDGDIKKS